MMEGRGGKGKGAECGETSIAQRTVPAAAEPDADQLRKRTHRLHVPTRSSPSKDDI